MNHMKHLSLITFTLTMLAGTALALGARAPNPGQPMRDIPGGKAITCAEFMKLGTTAATHVLYFADGYATGIEDQVAAGTPGPSGVAGTASPSSANSGVAPMSAAMTGLTLDQLRALCQVEPRAKVLAVIPGGRPVSGSGTISNDDAAAGGNALDTTNAMGTGAAPASGAPAAGNNAAVAGAGGGNAVVTDDAASVAAPSTAPTPTPSANPTVTTPATGSVAIDPTTGLSHATVGPGATATSPGAT